MSKTTKIIITLVVVVLLILVAGSKMGWFGEKGEFKGEPDFLVKERFMSKNDPCPCGSGKTLGECHYKGK